MTDAARARGRRAGFTLIELLIVIIIILIILGSVVALFSLMFRNAGLQQGALLVSTTLAHTKMKASNLRRAHYVDLIYDVQGFGSMQISMAAGHSISAVVAAY